MSDEIKEMKNRTLTVKISVSSSEFFALSEESFLREHTMTMADKHVGVMEVEAFTQTMS